MLTEQKKDKTYAFSLLHLHFVCVVGASLLYITSTSYTHAVLLWWTKQSDLFVKWWMMNRHHPPVLWIPSKQQEVRTTHNTCTISPFSLCMGRTVTENVHPIADDHHPRTVLRMRCGPPKTIINQWKRDHIKNAVYAGLSSRSAIFWIHQTSREENLSTRSICICICGVGSDFFFVVVVVRCCIYYTHSQREESASRCFYLYL